MYTFVKTNSNTDTSPLAAFVSAMDENDLETILLNFCKIVRILAMIPAMSYVAFSGLRRMKTYLRSTVGQQRLSDITLITVDKTYANNVMATEVENN